ncbi:MAG: MnhB domain-containing protein [Anaeromicrobium sp.]|jgi:multicomponent Na+:H+ antiporter subunit B|uniref:MnhB domain-containing protein n=1 Tax=Anaeromicrobium sp. TaxID=1929132 RepID=UPI0025E4DFF2|nr:MnhB domain-containing protein [Anaeromicrobium sp.]MCT4596237.1 MnhB domain-containing protein [Anaeromicrobium sp.]
MNSVILREILRFLIPLIQVFGIYVILFGHLSPGGGFSGGTIMGVSFILYRLVSDKREVRYKLSYEKLMKFMCLSLVFYGLLKGYYFIGDSFHLPVIPLGKVGHILSGGAILPLNMAVGIIVAITVYFLFSLFYEGEI